MNTELDLERAADLLARDDVTITAAGHLVFLVTDATAPNPVDGAAEAAGFVYVFTRVADQWVTS